MKNFFKLIIVFSIFHLYLFDVCKFVEHNFYLIALNKNTKEQDPKNLIGLNKYEYDLILDVNPFNSNDNYHLVLSVRFPININIELSPEIVYKYYSSKKFCLKDIAEGKQSNLVGKLVEYNSEIQILEKVWIEIIEVALYQEIKYIDRRKIFYFLGENVVKYNKKYLFLKKMNQSKEKQAYQIVRININDENDELKNIKIGTEFSVQDSSLDDFILREGLEYEAYALSGSDIRSYKFEKIENLICLSYTNEKIYEKCFDNENKKITYL